MCNGQVKNAFRFPMQVVDGQIVREGTRPIHFCHGCQVLVPAKDLTHGRAKVAGGFACCHKCQIQRQPARLSVVSTRHGSHVGRRFFIPRHRHSRAWKVACGG